MKKKLRLSVPIRYQKVYIKIEDNQIKMYTDKEYTQEANMQGCTINFEINQIRGLNYIEVIKPEDSREELLESIEKNFFENSHGLKKFWVILDSIKIKFNVNCGIIDINKYYQNMQPYRYKNWAMALYEYKDSKKGVIIWKYM